MVDEPKIDPIRDRYYQPLALAHRVGTILFYVSAALSLAIAVTNKASFPVAYEATQIVFIILVICLIVVGLAIRLYLFPRAQEKRFIDFLGHSYNVPLTHESTSGYYNVLSSDTTRRIAGQVMENAFYSKDTSQQMAQRERAVIGPYFVLWMAAVLLRNTGLETISIAAQILFSEQIISHWLRLEWFRSRCEQIYHEVEQLLQTNAELDVIAIEVLGRYEMSKSTSGIVLSDSIFHKRKAATDKEWQRIRSIYNL